MYDSKVSLPANSTLFGKLQFKASLEGKGGKGQGGSIPPGSVAPGNSDATGSSPESSLRCLRGGCLLQAHAGVWRSGVWSSLPRLPGTGGTCRWPSAQRRMATATCKPLALESASQGSSPPLRFFYAHFHDSIRSELDALSQSVLGLDGGADQRLLDRLLVLKKRYHFLEQVYNYHSSVEDEVRCLEK